MNPDYNDSMHKHFYGVFSEKKKKSLSSTDRQRKR